LEYDPPLVLKNIWGRQLLKLPDKLSDLFAFDPETLAVSVSCTRFC
jgi:hypothetical protein